MLRIRLAAVLLGKRSRSRGSVIVAVLDPSGVTRPVVAPEQKYRARAVVQQDTLDKKCSTQPRPNITSHRGTNYHPSTKQLRDGNSRDVG